MRTDQNPREMDHAQRRFALPGGIKALMLISIAIWDSPGWAEPAGTNGRTMTTVVQAALLEHPLVFIPDPHGNTALAAAEARLFRELEIPDRGLVLVLEFLNPRHQKRLDAYFLDLESVPLSELSTAWYDSTDIGTWKREDPSVLGLVAAVRARNEGLPRRQRIRVLGGGSPVDWNAVKTIDDLTRSPPKNRYTIGLIRHLLTCEVERPILVMYGNTHLAGPFWGAFGEGGSQEGFFVFSYYKEPETCGEAAIEWFDRFESGEACLRSSPGFSRGRTAVQSALTAGRGALLAKVEPAMAGGFRPQPLDDPELIRRMKLYQTEGNLEDLYRRNLVAPEFPRCQPEEGQP